MASCSLKFTHIPCNFCDSHNVSMFPPADADQKPFKDNIVEVIITMLKKRGWSAKFPTSCGGSREILMEMKKLANDPVSSCDGNYCD